MHTDVSAAQAWKMRRLGTVVNASATQVWRCVTQAWKMRQSPTLDGQGPCVSSRVQTKDLLT
jgi:hypothetical protein